MGGFQLQSAWSFNNLKAKLSYLMVLIYIILTAYILVPLNTRDRHVQKTKEIQI